MIADSAGANADLCYFPFYPTQFLNYDPITVNMLSQLASWQIRQCIDELKNMGLEVVEDGGWLILASCSSRVSAAVFFETIETVLYQSNKKIQINLKTAHDSDHPIAFEEGAYLKCAYYKIND